MSYLQISVTGLQDILNLNELTPDQLSLERCHITLPVGLGAKPQDRTLKLEKANCKREFKCFFLRESGHTCIIRENVQDLGQEQSGESNAATVAHDRYIPPPPHGSQSQSSHTTLTPPCCAPARSTRGEQIFEMRQVGLVETIDCGVGVIEFRWESAGIVGCRRREGEYHLTAW